MTLLEIEAFLAVVKYGTLSTAAQNLYITQPALTRRIQVMEEELGYPLFIRRKGYREVKLTEEGTEFYRIAWKWQRLWEETNSISANKDRETLAVASVDSLNHNMLWDLFLKFTEQGYLLRLYNAFSEDTYRYMERGIYDLAFITLQDYSQPLPSRTQVRPAYREAFVVASYGELPNDNGWIELEALQEDKEIFVAWNKEFKEWHANHFNEMISPVVVLEHAILALYFLKGDYWTFAPYTTGERFRKNGAHIYELKEAPPYQMIYYLFNGNEKQSAIRKFLELLNAKLKTMPPDKIQSFLG
ncbi:MAG TPA: LysR family transcriptional regulator [Candidatus Lachnoclostridium pullistercoris]|uniref:LysR family transcriptional regulator n=1 Tax=Candidatus Lachnoclostridium pullistercoris TaxID=2838632 RepID=A0A9D2PEN7_9FIRM|nr:LysR family transcriptional regulator [Candidatus Lachnoclostridium pullistercoris]